MKGIFWNIRGLNQPGRNLSLGHLIKDNNLDFVGIQETKKEEFLPSFLKNLTTLVNFVWHYLPAKKTAGGILLGVREEGMVVSNVNILKYSVSCMVYGSPYEDGKPEFIDELHSLLAVWQGPMIIGGILIWLDLYLIRVMVE
jgi:exonuclease III